MIITISYSSPDGSCILPIDINNSLYTLNLKEQLAGSGKSKISKKIGEHGGPYSPDVILSYKGIELNNMFALSRYGIMENDTVELSFTDKKEAPSADTPSKESKTCSVCGKKFTDTDMLRYHKGRLSPYEWVYGLTVKWQWTCCEKIVSTPESCYHPEGCSTGICPGCRPDCACNQARAIRRAEEENF
ncbi:MAG TPA: hypothetical protein PK358_10850 [Spirochaetota bacterium]|nr:hypothetical protein [Spirochaetota bacterium]HPJ35325.1 hypothetical protein [Spirochaetota bacterium]